MIATNRQKLVETIELTKIFKDFWGRERVRAVDRLNLSVYQGEILGLLGPNGSGKTTAVRMLLGLLFPTRGVIRVFGHSPRNVAVKRRIGYMPEESYLYQYLNAQETLDFYGRLFHLPSAERRRRVDYLIELVGLTRARHRPIREYSKGMARRIGLAQCLINDPDLIILDEPTTGLDPIGTREIKDLILRLKERGKTIILCSHLLADVEDVCDRISVLYGGRERAVGPIGELLSTGEGCQIITPPLKADTLERIKAIVREEEGLSVPIEIGKPRRSLEEFFMQVVEDARRERVVTSGADVGRVTEGFLLGAPPETELRGERLVEELVSSAREAGPAGPGPEEPRELHTGEPDRGLLGELTRAAEGKTAPAAGQEGTVQAPPETAVRRDVLDDLIEKPSDTDTSADKGPRTGKPDEQT